MKHLVVMAVGGAIIGALIGYGDRPLYESVPLAFVAGGVWGYIVKRVARPKKVGA